MAGPNHHSLAPILQELGDHDEALRRLQFAAKANPENLNVRNDLALAIFKRGREHWARALKEFTYILRVDADNFLAHKNIAAVYARRAGRYEKALEHALEAVKLRPDDAAAHRNLAQVYDVTGNSREAVVHNRRAIALGPGRFGQCMKRRTPRPPTRGRAAGGPREETASGHAHEHYARRDGRSRGTLCSCCPTRSGRWSCSSRRRADTSSKAGRLCRDHAENPCLQKRQVCDSAGAQDASHRSNFHQPTTNQRLIIVCAKKIGQTSHTYQCCSSHCRHCSNEQ